MEMKQKGDEGRVVGPEAEPHKMVVAVNPGEEVVAVAEPWLKPKNNDSLIPPKRRLVKRMMFDRIAKSLLLCLVFKAVHPPLKLHSPNKASGCLKMGTPPSPKAEKNGKKKTFTSMIYSGNL